MSTLGILFHRELAAGLNVTIKSLSLLELQITCLLRSGCPQVSKKARSTCDSSATVPPLSVRLPQSNFRISARFQGLIGTIISLWTEGRAPARLFFPRIISGSKSISYLPIFSKRRNKATKPVFTFNCIINFFCEHRSSRYQRLFFVRCCLEFIHYQHPFFIFALSGTNQRCLSVEMLPHTVCFASWKKSIPFLHSNSNHCTAIIPELKICVQHALNKLCLLFRLRRSLLNVAHRCVVNIMHAL